jgi:hypothetical protein
MINGNRRSPFFHLSPHAVSSDLIFVFFSQIALSTLLSKKNSLSKMGVKRQLESPKQNKSKSNATVISKRLRQAEVVDSEGELASVSGEKKTVQYPISISVDSGIALIYSTSRGGGR